MTEIAERPRILSPAIGRSREAQDRYEDHVRAKHEHGDTSCDLCRLIQEEKMGVGALRIVTHELEVFTKKLQKVSSELTLAKNEFGYDFFDGQMVDQHFMLIPNEHIAELKDFPRSTKKAYDYIQPFALQAFQMSFTRSPKSNGSSQKGHLHTHLMTFGEPVVELHYTQDDGTVVRRKGSDTLEAL